MDAQLSDFLLQDCQTLLDFDSVSDAGYYSACDGLSPASSCSSPSPVPLDSGSCSWSSPPSPLWSSRPGQDISMGLHIKSHTVDFQQQDYPLTSNSQPIRLQVSALPSTQQQRAAYPPQAQTSTCQQDKRLSRSRYPGRKRQSASEREKLRMRDLTKALHHLRSYLPPSVAPEGQTLTKIQTLRLASRYIAHLSAQLQGDHLVTGVKMEQPADPCHNRARPHAQGCPQDGPAAFGHCLQHQSSHHWSYHREPYTHPMAKHSGLQQNQGAVTSCLASAAQHDMTFYQQQNLMSIGHDFYYPLE